MSNETKKEWSHIAMFTDDQNAKEICKTWRECHHDTGPVSGRKRRVRFEGRGADRCAIFEKTRPAADAVGLTIQEIKDLSEWVEVCRIYKHQTNHTMLISKSGELMVITLDEFRKELA